SERTKFFSPRFQIMGLQPQSDLTLADRRDKAPLGRMLAEQFQRPAATPFRRCRAGQSDHLLLLSRREAWRAARSGGREPRTFQPLAAESPADITDSAFPAA